MVVPQLWIIVTSPSRSDLDGFRGKTVSRHVELNPDAVDDHDFCCALLCSPCSTTCCCIAVWAVGPLNQRNDFNRPSCQGTLYITGTGKSRYAGFCSELPTPRWIADQGLRAPSTLDIAKRLNHFHTSCLRKLLKIKWQDRIPDTEVLKRVGMQSIHTLL